MRKIKLLVMLLLAYSGMKAQNTALQFDGVDDYAEIVVRQNFGSLNGESFTFEAIVRAYHSGRDMVLLNLKQRSNQDLVFGIMGTGHLFLKYGQDFYGAETEIVNFNECQHVAVTLAEDEVIFYIDGQEVFRTHLNQTVNLGSIENIFVGMNFPDFSTSYLGEISELRLWLNARTDIQIATWFDITLSRTEVDLYIFLPFLEGTGNVTFDPRAKPYNYAFWKNGINIQWVPSCLLDVEPERVGVGTEPPCIPPSNVNNLICNGNFEQYHPILNNPPFWALYYDPYIPDFQGDDIVRWANSTPFGSPDFYVRDGIGDIPNPYFNLVSPNTWDWPNLSNNAMSALYSENLQNFGHYIEGIEQELLNGGAIGGQMYKFTGRFYTGSLWNPLLFDGQFLKLRLKSTQDPTQIYNGIPLQNLIDQNIINSNNGWQYIDFNFIVPLGYAFPFDIIEVQVLNKATQPSNGNGVYTFLDDLTLVHVIPPIDNCNSCFQAHIGSGINNDTFHRRIAIDANNNVYITGKVSNDSPTGLNLGFAAIPQYFLAGNTLGSYVAKYSSTGSLNWVQFFQEAIFNDIEILPNGNVLCVGGTSQNSAGSTIINWVQTFNIPVVLPWGVGTIDETMSSQLLVSELNSSNGSLISMDAYGGSGYETGIDATIVGNMVYITCKVNNQIYEFLNPAGPNPGPYKHLEMNNSGLFWSSPTNPITSSIVLRYDYSNQAKTEFSNYSPNDFQMISAFGSSLIVLTENELHKLDLTNTLGTGFGQSLNLSGLQKPRNLHITTSGDIYISYLSKGLTKHNVATLGLVSSSTEQYYSVTGIGNDVFALGLEGNSLKISKLDLNPNATLGQAVWSRYVTGSHLNMFNYFHSSDDLTVMDIKTLGNSGKLVFTSNFETPPNLPLGSNWSLNFGSKLMQSPVCLNAGHTFVATLDDLGQNARFKWENDSTAATKNYTVFPNPSRDFINVESTKVIKSYRLFSIQNDLIRKVIMDNSTKITIDLMNISAGVYVLEIEFQDEIAFEKIIIE